MGTLQAKFDAVEKALDESGVFDKPDSNDLLKALVSLGVQVHTAEALADQAALDLERAAGRLKNLQS